MDSEERKKRELCRGYYNAKIKGRLNGAWKQHRPMFGFQNYQQNIGKSDSTILVVNLSYINYNR